MAFGALVLSLAVVGPAALVSLASPAAADIGAPDRASVPVESHAAASNVLPGDGNDVRIDMTENDGLDVIVAASGAGATVSAPGVSGATAVRFQQSGSGTWNIETGGSCGGPWSAPVLTNQTNPVASPVSGLLTLCVASTWPTPCPGNHRRAGPHSAAPARRA
jgi:hypothetical protein